jgi:MATE family multidrug resistance protein
MSPRSSITWRAHFSAILRLGLPLIGGHLAQIAIGVTDTVMLGWYGVGALAAGALGASVFNVLMLVGSGFAFAVMPLVAGAVTRSDDDQLQGVTRMGLWLSAAFAVAVLPLMYWSGALLFFGQDPEVAANAQNYLRIAGWGMFPALFAMVGKSVLSALERTRVILWVTVLAAGCNAVVNWVLIFGNLGFPELGLRGAATASLMAHAAALGGIVIYTRVWNAPNRHSVFAGVRAPDWPRLLQVFSLGWPIGITMLAEAGLFTASAIMVGLLGEAPLAAHGIAMQLASVTFMVHLGLSQVATVRAGQAMSADDPVSLRRGAIVVAVCSAAFAAVAISVFLLAPEFLIGLFLSLDDVRAPEIVPIATSLLLAAALFQFADGAQVIALGLLRGLQDTRAPMIIAGVIYWCVAAPAGYLLAFKVGLGGQGVWFGLVIGLGLAAIGLCYRFVRRLARMR